MLSSSVQLHDKALLKYGLNFESGRVKNTIDDFKKEEIVILMIKMLSERLFLERNICDTNSKHPFNNISEAIFLE